MAVTSQKIVIFGGTGFLGRQVNDLLREAGHDIVVASRHRDDAGNWIEADVTEPETVRRAVAGAEAVVNCVSLYREKPHLKFNDVHVLGAGNVAQAAHEAGVLRLVQISGIGADRYSESVYVSARGKGEKAVREAFPTAVILRPSAMTGPDNDLLSTIAGIPDWLPAIPLFGNGGVLLQPVHSGDVARAIRRVLEAKDMDGAVCELGGPDVMSYADLLRLVMDLRGDRRPLIPFPMAGWSLLAHTAGAVGLAPVTEGTVALMRHDNVANPDLPGLAALGIHDPVSVEETARQRFGHLASD